MVGEVSREERSVVRGQEPSPGSIASREAEGLE